MLNYLSVIICVDHKGSVLRHRGYSLVPKPNQRTSCNVTSTWRAGRRTCEKAAVQARGEKHSQTRAERSLPFCISPHRSTFQVRLVCTFQWSTAGWLSVPFHQGTPKFKPPTRTHTAQKIQNTVVFFFQGTTVNHHSSSKSERLPQVRCWLEQQDD